MLKHPPPSSGSRGTDAETSGQSVLLLQERQSSSHFTFSDTCGWKLSTKRVREMRERRESVMTRPKVNRVHKGWKGNERNTAEEGGTDWEHYRGCLKGTILHFCMNKTVKNSRAQTQKEGKKLQCRKLLTGNQICHIMFINKCLI